MKKTFLENFDREFEKLPIAHSDACGDSPMKECNFNCPYFLIKSFFHSQIEKLISDVKKCVPSEDTFAWYNEVSIKSLENITFQKGFNSCRSQTLKSLENLK